MSLENRPIDYGDKGFSWTNESMHINVPELIPFREKTLNVKTSVQDARDSIYPAYVRLTEGVRVAHLWALSHSREIALTGLATSLALGAIYELSHPDIASALQDPTPYPLKCEPIVENGLGAIDGIPTELQGRATCFDVNGQQESVIFYCDKVLNTDPSLAVLDGNSTNQSALCYEGPSDINRNGASDYNPIKPDVGAINGLNAPEAVTTPTSSAPPPASEPSTGEALAAVGGMVLFLLFGGFLNAKKSYESGHHDGEIKGISTGGEIEEAVKSNPEVKKISNKVRKAERKKRGIKKS